MKDKPIKMVNRPPGTSGSNMDKAVVINFDV